MILSSGLTLISRNTTLILRNTGLIYLLLHSFLSTLWQPTESFFSTEFFLVYMIKNIFGHLHPPAISEIILNNRFFLIVAWLGYSFGSLLDFDNFSYLWQDKTFRSFTEMATSDGKPVITQLFVQLENTQCSDLSVLCQK